jgi:hypothetical protein
VTALSVLEWVIVLLAALASVELIVRLPIGRLARRLASVPRHVLRTLHSSSRSDELKQRVLLFHARVLIGASASLAVLILLGFLPLLAAFYGLGGDVAQASVIAVDAAVLAVLTTAAVLYLVLRRWWYG